VWFFVQSALSPGPGEGVDDLLAGTARTMPGLFVVFPLLAMIYWKVDLRETFALRLPPLRHLCAALMIGAVAWVPAHEVNVLQVQLVGLPDGLAKNFELIDKAVTQMTLGRALLLLAVVPALCEELLFRGVLLSGLASASRKWTAILASAAIFGVFHFVLFRFPVTAGLGVVLALLCWSARSIVPAILAHLLHNGISVGTAIRPEWRETLGIHTDASFAHLPIPVLLIGGIVFVAGFLLTLRRERPDPARASLTTPAPVAEAN